MNVKGDDVEKSSERESTATGMVAIIFFLLSMIGAAVWYFTYDFPGGEGTIGGFVIIFLREILILAILIIGIGIGLIYKLRRSSSSGGFNRGMGSTKSNDNKT